MPDSRVPTRIIGSVDADVDGQRVVLSPKDFAYFGIEGSGAHVWDLIDGVRSVDDIVTALEAEFEAPEGDSDGVIRAETLAFLDSLVAAGLVAELGPPPAEA
jgi:hypothetical protein